MSLTMSCLVALSDAPILSSFRFVHDDNLNR